MFYVYIIQSINYPNHYYTGRTTDVMKRIADHNHGKSYHTSKYRPWKLVNYTAFVDEAKANAFERYLKTGSGIAFSNRHFR